MKLATIWRIEEGNLRGTEIQPFLGTIMVKYPHRKTRDLYILPMKGNGKEITTFHCCQENCQSPDFEGNMDALVKHLELHTGRLFKQLQPITPTCPARIVVSLPPNPWAEGDERGANPDRRFTVHLYRETVRAWLAKQGIGIWD